MRSRFPSRPVAPATCLLLLLLLAASPPPRAVPSRFATRVVASNHPGGQSSGTLDLLLGGPRGEGGGAGSVHVWSLGVDTTGGDAAFVTLGFDVLIVDGPGPDFLVFENAQFFGADPTRCFAELVFVEVSSDGTTFARFPPSSTTPEPVGAFGTLDPAATGHLAGHLPVWANVERDTVAPSPFRAGDPASDPTAAGGTAFDLAALRDAPEVLAGAVDLTAIRVVRLVDVYGSGVRLDAAGRPIYDPTSPTNAADIDAVAVVHFREPEPPAWTQFGRGAEGEGRVFADAAIRVFGPATWRTPPSGLVAGGGVVMLPADVAAGRPELVVARGVAPGAGAGGADAVVVRAFEAATGRAAWTSAPLPAGDAIAFDGIATPAADAAGGGVVVASGGVVARLSAADGAATWTRPLDAGGSSEVINGSLRVDGARAYLVTYGGFDPAAKRLYAVELEDGDVAWSVQDGGPGSEAPAVYRWEGSHLVATLRPRGMAAYDAATGAAAWSHDAPLEGEAWESGPFFGGLVHRDGALLAATYPFGGTAELVCVHAASGRLQWRAATVAAGGAPLVHGQRVFVVGHGPQWGDASWLVAHDLATGAELGRTQLAPASSAWNATPVATNDALYVTGGVPDYFPSATGLHRVDPATLAVAARAPLGPALPTGTPAIGRDGSLYVLGADGSLAAWRARAPVGATGWVAR